MNKIDVRKGVTLYQGDCLDVLPTLDEGSVDALVTDPPAGIAFMNLEFDSFPLRDRGALPGGKLPKQTPHKHGRGFANGMTIDKTPRSRGAFTAFLTAIMKECLRVLKPGAYGLVWAIPRTSHWTAMALEDAGFEVRDCITHLFGTGFPKAKSCLKPAAEFWWLVRKPGRGVAPLPGLDECRVGTTRDVPASLSGCKAPSGIYGDFGGGDPKELDPNRGRWPPNVVLSHHEECRCIGTKRVKGSNGVRGASTKIYGGGKGFTQATGEEVGYAAADGLETVESWECHPECPVAELDRQSGESTSTGGRKGGHLGGNGIYEAFSNMERANAGGLGDSGSASRFFYTAKASRKERGEGNDHPTVKPLALMEWLVKLACPKGGTILDPFLGSGTTGKACVKTGREFIGIEKEEKYLSIAQKRIAKAKYRATLFDL